MAQFDTEYQRLEASYSDSPPGEEDLLVHVPEGSKCEFLAMTARAGAWGRIGGGTMREQGALTSLFLCPQHLGTTSKTLTFSSLEYPLRLCVGVVGHLVPL